VHTLGALQGVLLLALGFVWPNLNLGGTTSRVAFWLLIYSALAILIAFVLGTVWGAGSETMRVAAGTDSSASIDLVAFVLILWGLRIEAVQG
jgi:(hydroxyamino)benzene mutase